MGSTQRQVGRPAARARLVSGGALATPCVLHMRPAAPSFLHAPPTHLQVPFTRLWLREWGLQACPCLRQKCPFQR